MSAVQILDYRHLQRPAGPKVKAGGKRPGMLSQGVLVKRDPRKVTGITLHQTACYFGDSNGKIDPMRALRVHAHATVFGNGTGVLAYPLLSYVYHGNGANATRIGLEMEGLFPGKGGIEIAPALLIEATKDTILKIIEEAKKEGIEIFELDAHRQWSAMRRGDPGAELWRKIVVEWAVPVIGLKVNQAFYDPSNGGKPIPKDWDPNGVGRY